MLGENLHIFFTNPHLESGACVACGACGVNEQVATECNSTHNIKCRIPQLTTSSTIPQPTISST